ncbi:5283_t:CDS:2, partial [Entrophospora sp. SA101]
MGVINLDDERKNKSNDIIENQRIKNILKEILQITNIDKANEFIDKYKVLINIKLDAESIIDNFIFSVVNIFSGFFILDNNYFKDQYSENHIGAVIYAPLFNNLFRQECYSIRLNDQLLANKERRNLGNEERVRLALVPDIKLTYLRGNMEIIVIEHQKQIILDGLKKNKKDTTKITIMMHDLLTKISKDLDSRELSDHIKNINVFGVITSSKYYNNDELFLTEMNQDFNFCGKNVHPADDTQSKWHLLSLFDSNLEPPTFLE